MSYEQEPEQDPRYEPPAISEQASDLQRQIAREMAPPPEVMLEVKRYYAVLQQDLTRRAGEIETFLGFVDHADNLAQRVAKIEKFLGLGG